MAFMERCTYCRVIHYPRQYPAVYLGGQYFCKPSCYNAHGKEQLNEVSDTCSPAARLYE